MLIKRPTDIVCCHRRRNISLWGRSCNSAPSAENIRYGHHSIRDVGSVDLRLIKGYFECVCKRTVMLSHLGNWILMNIIILMSWCWYRHFVKFRNSTVVQSYDIVICFISKCSYFRYTTSYFKIFSSLHYWTEIWSIAVG